MCKHLAVFFCSRFAALWEPRAFAWSPKLSALVSYVLRADGSIFRQHLGTLALNNGTADIHNQPSEFRAGSIGLIQPLEKNPDVAVVVANSFYRWLGTEFYALDLRSFATSRLSSAVSDPAFGHVQQWHYIE